MNPARELREQRMKIAKDMVALSDKGLKTPEEQEQWRAMDADQKALEVRIGAIEASATLAASMSASGAPPNGQPGAAPEQRTDKEKEERRTGIYRKYLRYGEQDGKHPNGVTSVEIAEYRDMGEAGLGTGAATAGGIFVPVGFVYAVESALKYYGPMLDGGAGMPSIMTTATGQSLPYPTDNDTTSVGEQIGEGQQVNTLDVTLGQITFGAWKYSSKMVRISMELLQDSAFDFDTFLPKKFAERLGRILNTKFTTGAGTTEPLGIVTAAASAGTAVGANSNDGVSGPNTLGSDDLTTLEHSIDPLYRGNARFMFHDSTLAALKKVKDKYGRPLWMPSIREGEPDRINGYKYAINNDMAQLQTVASSPVVTNKTVIFGALDKYMIRQVKEMSVLRLEERFADYGQVAFLAFCRYDAQLLDAGTHPVKYLQNVY